MAEDQRVRTTRRQFLKGAVATGTGVAAAAYVKPSLRVLGVPGALAQVSDPPTPTTPIDSSVTGSTDVTTPDTTLPALPSTGGGGMSSTSTASITAESSNDNSRLPELVALAVAGGLLGRRAALTLRDNAGRDGDDAAPDSSPA